MTNTETTRRVALRQVSCDPAFQPPGDGPDVSPAPQVASIVGTLRVVADLIHDEWAWLTSEEEPHSVLADALADLADISEAVNNAHHHTVTGEGKPVAAWREDAGRAAHYLGCSQETADRLATGRPQLVAVPGGAP